MIATLPLAVALTAVFVVSGALTLVCAPDPGRPPARPAAPVAARPLDRPAGPVAARPLDRPVGPVAARPLERLAAPAMAAAMVAMTWTRLGALALSWPAILFTAVAGVHALRADGLRAVAAAASVWMLVAPPAPLPALGVGATLLATAAVWITRARRRPGTRTDAGSQALMAAGMAAMLAAMATGH